MPFQPNKYYKMKSRRLSTIQKRCSNVERASDNRKRKYVTNSKAIAPIVSRNKSDASNEIATSSNQIFNPEKIIDFAKAKVESGQQNVSAEEFRKFCSTFSKIFGSTKHDVLDNVNSRGSTMKRTAKDDADDNNRMPVRKRREMSVYENCKFISGLQFGLTTIVTTQSTHQTYCLN